MVAVVAGATRGAGRAMAVSLGARGFTVYATGRSARGRPATPGRPETIDETAEMVTSAGGRGIAVRVDHTRPDEVAALFARVAAEQDGRLDVLVNDVWGGDALSQWGTPFWESDLQRGLLMQRQAVHSHIITSRYGLPPMVERRRGLLIEVTDGVGYGYRGEPYYSLAKISAIHLAEALAPSLRAHGVAAVALTPGFLRSEAILDLFGVTEGDWRRAIPAHPDFAGSETPYFAGRAVAALATDPAVMAKSGQTLSSWDLSKEYGFTDADGRRPDWGAFFARFQAATDELAGVSGGDDGRRLLSEALRGQAPASLRAILARPGFLDPFRP